MPRRGRDVVLQAVCCGFALLGFVFLLVSAFAALPAAAEDSPLLARGDAVVTGFSGTKPADPPAAAGDPLDEVFIDLDGASAQILKLEPGAPPAGQLVDAPSVLRVKARDVGQVFAIGIDDSLLPDPANGTPSIYLGATSAFGLQIVLPDSDGDGRPERVRKGHPNAEWMAGQFGLDKGGEPGSIFKIDGKTGAVSLFATIPGNSGPGIGDIVFDQASLHFFVSDLDTGLIHRLDSAGNIIDAFDHGQAGRRAAGLSSVVDDGKTGDIKNPVFDSEKPATWGFTQAERRVWGLGLRAGRLYYATSDGPAIWSVSIGLDGKFGGDPRREIEVSGTPNNHPIADIAFDNADFMYVAQRGGVKGSYDYSVFADSKQSVVFRFRREIPDDPATPGIWVPIPDEYAVGFPPDHRNTAGGLAPGYGYDQVGKVRQGACDTMVWSTGDALFDNPNQTLDLATRGLTVIHGLQGADRALTRPDNEPPEKSYFADYDGVLDESRKQGHLGDVEIWQPCDPKADFGTYAPVPYLPPGYVPPTYTTPDETPPDGIPPVGTPGWDFNLRLDKEAVSGACVAGGLGFLCDYVVRVTNTGPDAYAGPIVVNDKLPAAPAGAVMTFANIPPWFCIAISPTEHQCTFGPALLGPGESVDLHVTVDLPVAAPVCHLDNLARIVWPLGLGDANPADDFDLATATIPAAHCPPPAGEKTNLKIEKLALEEVCKDKGGDFECRYLVAVRNMGPGVYNGPVTVGESIPPGATATFGPAALWTPQGANTWKRAPVTLQPTQFVLLHVLVKVPKNQAAPLGCTATNKAKIVEAAGGTDQNTDPNDDEAEAKALLPGQLAQCPGQPALSNLKLKKTGLGEKCPVSGGNWVCKFTVTAQNFGAAYTSPIQFADLPFGAPPGAKVEFQPPAGWSCGGPLFWNEYHCKSDNPNLAHLEKVEIPVTVKIPVAPTAKCEITNNAQIVKAPGGTLLNSFAGDDMSSATAQLAPAFPQGGGQGICLSGNLKLSKLPTVSKLDGGYCPVSGGAWECPFTLAVTNHGDLYTSEIEVIDTLPLGTPAGATVTFQEPAGWNCAGPLFWNHYHCRSKNPKLKPNEAAVIRGIVRIPLGPIEGKCGITNRAKIVKPPGGASQNLDATDDFASVTMKLKPDVVLPDGQVACPTKRSNLKIEKTPWRATKPEGLCLVSGFMWVCEWKVRITNFGEAYTSPIEVLDHLWAAPTGANLTLSEPVGWDCTNLGTQSSCRSENPNLKDGESIEFAAVVRVALGPVADCTIMNRARIDLAQGGDPLNFDATDDSSSSTQTLNGHYLGDGKYACLSPAMGEPEPPLVTPPGKETNLTITKTAGACDATATSQNCAFAITVTNKGPGAHSGPIEVLDTLFDGATVEPSNGSWSAPWAGEGQAAAGHPEQGLFTHPPVELDPGESVVLDLEIEAPNSYVAPSGSQVKCGYKNKVEILDPPGGSPQNTNANDDSATAAVTFEPFEKHGTTFCGPDLPPPPPACPQGWSRTPVPGKCCPPRTRWDGERCKRGEPPPEEKCPANSVGDYPDCRCKSGFTGRPPNCREIGEPEVCNRTARCLDGRVWSRDACACVCPPDKPWNPALWRCGSVIVDPPRCPGGQVRIGGFCRCPQGTRWIDGKCRTRPEPPQTCGPNAVGTYPNCRCASGFTGAPPNCKPIEDCKPKKCGRGETWDREACACVPKSCPEGWTGRYPDCKPPEKQCPLNSVGKYPDCRCKRSFTGTPPDCKPVDCPSGQRRSSTGACVPDSTPPPKCPADSVGKPPNCRCKPGTTGAPGDCKRIVVDPPKVCPPDSVGKFPRCRCRPGTVGKPGNCKRVVEPPKTCPKGFTGALPNCKRVVEPPKTCPKGFTGRPPNCRAIITRRPCPKGMIGIVPNCRPARTQRIKQLLRLKTRPSAIRPAFPRKR